MMPIWLAILLVLAGVGAGYIIGLMRGLYLRSEMPLVEDSDCDWKGRACDNQPGEDE